MTLSNEDRARMRVHYAQAVIAARSLGASTWDAQTVLDLLDDLDEARAALAALESEASR